MCQAMLGYSEKIKFCLHCVYILMKETVNNKNDVLSGCRIVL